MDTNQNKIKTFAIFGSIGFIVLVLIIFLIIKNLNTNQYGNQIVINNFSNYYPNTPAERKESIFATLFRAVTDNVDDINQIPKNGALIREGAQGPDFDEKTGITHINFYVDIDSIQQSYQVQYEWANNEANQANLSGYQGLVTCIRDPNYIIYKDFQCQDMFTNDRYSTLAQTYPIIKDLPLVVDEYSDGYGTYTYYTISYDAINQDPKNFKLIIMDYTGGNYQKALDAIRKLGYDPKSYTIEYTDAAGTAPGYAGDD